MVTVEPAHSTALPGPAEPDEIVHFESDGKVELYGEYFAADKPRAQALILHGYAEHGGRYREVANLLRSEGVSSLAFDMRGHGRSSGQRGHVERYEDYLADVEAALAELSARSGCSSTILICHSNGALVGLRLIADPFRCPETISAAVLSSPFLGLKLKVSPIKSTVAKIAGLVLPKLSLPNDIDINTLTHDADKLAERRLDTLCHEVASARWFTEALSTQEWVTEFAHRIEIPTLWLIAGDDQIADASASVSISAKLGMQGRVEVLDGMYHEVFNEAERARVFALVGEFLRDSALPQG